MSRVERTENPSERRGSEQLRQAQKKDPNVGHTPSKAEGEQSDVEEALKHQQE
jgi:hypothetical protein